MVLLESPTNPMLKIADIQGIVDLVRKGAPEALIVLDNTMMSPYLQRPLELGVDIVYDSGTKYLSGHHDLMAGVMIARTEAVGKRLAWFVNAAGTALAPFDCFLLLRGRTFICFCLDLTDILLGQQKGLGEVKGDAWFCHVREADRGQRDCDSTISTFTFHHRSPSHPAVKTLPLRMDRQQSTTTLLANYLHTLGFTVHYPGLVSDPGHALHFSQAKGAGAVLSFETGDIGVSEGVVAGTTIFGISVSFGAVNSLISMPCLMR